MRAIVRPPPILDARRLVHGARPALAAGVNGGSLRRQTTAAVATEESLRHTVQQRDYGAYLTHFAYPRALQGHFFALRAFHLELASIKDDISNEFVGRIRMGWWRDAIRGIYQVHAVRCAR